MTLNCVLVYDSITEMFFEHKVLGLMGWLVVLKAEECNSHQKVSSSRVMTRFLAARVGITTVL